MEKYKYREVCYGLQENAWTHQICISANCPTESEGCRHCSTATVYNMYMIHIATSTLTNDDALMNAG